MSGGTLYAMLAFILGSSLPFLLHLVFGDDLDSAPGTQEMLCSRKLQSPAFQLVPPACTNTYQLSVNITTGSGSRGKNGYLVWRTQIWLESASLHGNFSLGNSGGLLDSKTAELGFSQRTAANHVVWTTFGTLLATQEQHHLSLLT